MELKDLLDLAYVSEALINLLIERKDDNPESINNIYELLKTNTEKLYQGVREIELPTVPEEIATVPEEIATVPDEKEADPEEIEAAANELVGAPLVMDETEPEESEPEILEDVNEEIEFVKAGVEEKEPVSKTDFLTVIVEDDPIEDTPEEVDPAEELVEVPTEEPVDDSMERTAVEEEPSEETVVEKETTGEEEPSEETKGEGVLTEEEQLGQRYITLIEPAEEETPVEPRPEPRSMPSVEESIVYNDLNSRVFSRRTSDDFQKMINLGDWHRFYRELFGKSSIKFNDAIDMVRTMKSYPEAEEYFYDYLRWNPDDDNVKDFMNLVRLYLSQK